MTSRLRSLTVLLLALAAPVALARVISYAPYTNQLSIPSYHLRTARYFALIEGRGSLSPRFGAQVVLYDSTGTDEPRVIYPSATESRNVDFVAIHEPRNGAAQIVLSSHDQVQGQFTRIYLFSNDAGRTWTQIKELDGLEIVHFNDADFGGPYSRGLSAPVSIGGKNPFVLSLTSGLHSVGSDGKAKLLLGSPGTASWYLTGRNKDGTKILARSTQGHLAIVDDPGKTTNVGTIEPSLPATGWITPDGSVYVQLSLGSGKQLYFYRNQERTLIHEPYDIGNFSDQLSAFAVPTSDYSGAWLLKRATGKATVLARHTRATGVETFWSDVSGPQVEALHTGDDPNKLLIQVHRPRQQPERWFIDPALALWTVGQPAPRHYDELFLNETPAKGFLHLDVDLVAQGEPFVFDSGAPQAFNDCQVCSPGGGAGGGGDVVQEWGVVRASLKQRLVLPGVARQAGAFNSYWLTDVVIHNPLEEPQEVRFEFVPMGELHTAAVIEKRETLAPREIRVMTDVLKSLFALESGGGAIYIEPNVAVTATARTYTRNDKGTFGFGMPAIDAMNASSPRFPVSFAGAFPGREYRTNMILTDTSGRGTEARLLAHGISGRMGVDTLSFTAPVNGLLQMNGLAGMLGLGGTDSGGLLVQPTRGSAIATVVAMDNRTNDPTYFPPDLPAPMVRTIPVIGHTAGAHNSQFRSDLYLLNSGTSPRTIRLEAKPWDAHAAAKQVFFTLLPGEARVIRDALPTLFGMEGVARLRFGATDGTDGVRVTSRTYNVDEHGGTYGCLIPPLNNFQSAAGGETLEILGIVGGGGFRTNLGLVELTPNFNGQNAEARITIVDDTGKTLDSFPIAVATASGTQINDLFGARGIAQPKAAIVYIEVTRGIIGAYATLTDNATNDSTYLGANLSAQPN